MSTWFWIGLFIYWAFGVYIMTYKFNYEDPSALTLVGNMMIWWIAGPPLYIADKLDKIKI